MKEIKEIWATHDNLNDILQGDISFISFISCVPLVASVTLRDAERSGTNYSSFGVNTNFALTPNQIAGKADGQRVCGVLGVSSTPNQPLT